MNPISFVIRGAPRTKKNSQKIIYIPSANGNKRPIPIPSADYQQYSKDFIWQIPGYARKSISNPVNVKCLYYMPTKRRVDLLNLLEATCDILVEAGVIADDNCKVVVSHDGSRVLYDKENPRVEIEITPSSDREYFCETNAVE